MASNTLEHRTSTETSELDLDFNPEAMGRKLLADSLAPVQPDLDVLRGKITSFLPADTHSAQKIIEHIFESGGKRIRPALYFFCARLFDYRGEHLYPIAAVSEFVHTASLLHDDVVDNSTLRRNKPTANASWGDQSSVLVGDLIYARASEMMAATGSLEIVTTYAQAIRLMSEGELFQLEQCFDISTPKETYFKIIRYKTATLIAACCRAAAILGGGRKDEVECLAQFGAAVGTAFQLVDDALDYLGEREIFGKPTLSDLKEGKVTLPVLMLKDLASKDERELIKGVLSKPGIDTYDVKSIAQLVAHYETAEKTVELAQEYTNKAVASLQIFAESEARNDLELIAKRMVGRFS